MLSFSIDERVMSLVLFHWFPSNWSDEEEAQSDAFQSIFQRQFLVFIAFFCSTAALEYLSVEPIYLSH